MHIRSWLFIFFVTFLAFASTAQAVLFNNSSGDGKWSTDANWNPSGVPGGVGYTEYVFMSCIEPGLLSESSVIDYAAPTLEDSRLNMDQYSTLNVVLGGSITLGNWSCVGRAGVADGKGTLNISGDGSVLVEGIFCTALQSNRTAEINVGNTGTLTVTGIWKFEDGKSTVNLSDSAVITAYDLDFDLNPNPVANCVIDIADDAKLLVKASNYSSSEALSDISRGCIIGVELDVSTVNISGTNYTQIISLPTQAWEPYPDPNAIDVLVSPTLSWSASLTAASHDVYLGTDKTAVTNATRLLGDVNGDGGVDLSDVSSLASQWLTSPGVLTPSGDLNDDSNVDIADLLVVAGDWLSVGDGIFKGHQPLGAETYSPSEMLNYNTKYFWRIDEVNGASVWPGAIWEFTTIQAPETYYVSMTGSDSNPGTIGLPFATIGKAADVLEPGDTCYVREGTYHQTASITGLSGLEGAEIIFQPYPGETVLFDGNEAIADLQTNGWTHHSGNIYKTTLSKDIWQLFVDGEMMMSARWPNASIYDNSIWEQDANWGWGSTASDFGTMATRTGYDSGTGVQRPDLAATGLDFTGAMAILNIGKWQTHSRIVNSHAAGSGTFTYDADHRDVADPKFWQDGYWEETQRYYFECHINCLDVAKEWYYNPATKELYLWAPDGQIPSGDIRGKTMTYAFDFDDVEHITVKGLKFFGCTFSFLNSAYCTVEDCDLEYYEYTQRMLGVEDPGLYDIFTCSTKMYGPTDGSYNSIRNCSFAYCDGGAITVEGKYDLFENILAHDLDFSGVGYHTFHFQGSSDSVIKRLTAYNAGASESISGGLGNIVELCDMGAGLGTLQQDGATIQFRPTQQFGSIVRNCWVHDNTKFGIRTDMNPVETWPTWWGMNTLIHNNVVWGITMRGTQKPAIMVEGDEHQTYNNLSFDNETRDICLPTHIGDGPITAADHPNQDSITRNNLTGLDGIGVNRLPNGDNPPGIADHNIETNVRNIVVDFDNRDFRPKAGSVVIDAGLVIPGVTDGYLNSAPDVGAYEHGAADYWIPGYQTANASRPIPSDSSTVVAANVDLIWLGGWEGISYDVYFGATYAAVDNADKLSGEFKNTQENNIYTPSGLTDGVQYFWRIDTQKASGEVIKGDVWSFLF